jgi:hypothetical protein
MLKIQEKWASNFKIGILRFEFKKFSLGVLCALCGL